MTSLPMCPLPEEASEESVFSGHRTFPVERWKSDTQVHAIDQIAEEIPVAMIYNGISHAVMLATPTRLEQFGLGFSLSEGILQQPGELYGCDIVTRKEGIELQMTIPQQRFAELKQRRRNMTGRTGCGLCGTESLQQVQRAVPQLAAGQRFHAEALHRALETMPLMQSLQGLTGAVHAAAWADVEGNILLLEEDIGRHNALDKLLGALATSNHDRNQGFVLISSRASYEMVQKATTLGISMLAAVSAPTSMAIEVAQRVGLTLVGFARKGGHVVYAHSERFI